MSESEKVDIEIFQDNSYYDEKGIASLLKVHFRTVGNWRKHGKVTFSGSRAYLRMVKLPTWKSKGTWLKAFFLKCSK